MMSKEDREQTQQWSACPQSKVELHAEIDRLRLRNQELHIALVRAQRWRPKLRKMVHGTLLRGRKWLWDLLGRVSGRPPAPQEPSGYPQFTPYRVVVQQANLVHRPRILHVIANFYTGGSAQLVVDLIERLGHRFEQEVVSRHLPVRPSYTGLRLHHLTKWSGVADTYALLTEFEPHLVHVHFLGHHESAYGQLDWEWYHEIFEALEQLGVKVVENLNIPVEPYISNTVQCYVHVSDFVRCQFGRVDSHNITIYPGSDLHLFSPPDGQARAEDHIGMVYRLEDDKLGPKGIEPLIEAVRRRENTKAIVVGGGTYLAHYRERVARAGLQDAFLFTGYVPYAELPRLYRQMSLFVAPVHTESFGQVSAFAMGMELPVVGYRVGALPEIVGETGLLAPPGNTSALADIIVDLLDDRERRLRIGRSNRRRAEAHFSVEAMIDQYAQLYADLLN